MSPPTVPFVDLHAQHRPLQTALLDALGRVIERGDFILGEELERFEEEFAAFCGARFAVGVDSGMSAIELGLRAFGVGPGDEVMTAANTFIATASAISAAGATPVLVDADPLAFNLDPAALEAAITPRTRAIVPVHLYGQPAEMHAIVGIARRHHLVVFEDACQAHGARYHDARAGALGDAAAFSFYPSKNLGCLGDGGALVTSDARIADAARVMRNYGQREKYRHESLPYNRRLDTLQAATLRVKLPHLDGWNEARARHAEAYARRLSGVVETPVTLPGRTHVYHVYVVRHPRRDELRDRLRDRGISTGIHYPIPIHLQPCYQSLGYRAGSFPVTERSAREGLSLPMFPELSADQIERVTAAVRECAA